MDLSAPTGCKDPEPKAKAEAEAKAKGATAIRELGDEIDLDFASYEGLLDGDGHRSGDSSSSTNALGLVTRTISPKEPEFHSKRGKADIQAEVADLRAAEAVSYTHLTLPTNREV